jgi:hypothetical protein
MSELSVQAKMAALGTIGMKVGHAGGESLLEARDVRNGASKGMGCIFWVPAMADAERIVREADADLAAAYRMLIGSRECADEGRKAKLDAKAIEGEDFTLSRYRAYSVLTTSREGMARILANRERQLVAAAEEPLMQMDPGDPHYRETKEKSEKEVRRIEAAYEEAVSFMESADSGRWRCRTETGQARRISYFSASEKKRKHVNVGDLLIIACEEKPAISMPKPRASVPRRAVYAQSFGEIDFTPLDA